MKKLQTNNKFIIATLLFLGIGGLVGGLSFVTKPDGTGLGMTTEFLKHSPVTNYFWPGVFLILFMSIWPFVNIYGLIAKKSWVNVSLVLLGALSIVWIIYETIVIQTFSPLQPIIALIGMLLMGGGLIKHKYRL